jgi:hypothetical protein
MPSFHTQTMHIMSFYTQQTTAMFPLNPYIIRTALDVQLAYSGARTLGPTSFSRL